MNDKGTTSNALFVSEALSKEQQSLFAVIFALLGGGSDVMDVLQDANVAILEHAGEYDPSRPVQAWLKGFAVQQVMVYRKQKRREKLVFDSEMVDQLGEMVAEETPQPLQDGQDADSVDLDECFKKLPKWERDLLRERYEKRVQVAEMAKKRSVTRVSLSVLMFRLRKALRDCIEKRRAGRLAPEDGGDPAFVADMEALFDGASTEEERRDLTARMAADPALRAVYLRHSTVHALLAYKGKKGLPLQKEDVVSPLHSVCTAALTAVACLALLLAGGLLFARKNAVARPETAPAAQELAVRQEAEEKNAREMKELTAVQPPSALSSTDLAARKLAQPVEKTFSAPLRETREEAKRNLLADAEKKGKTSFEGRETKKEGEKNMKTGNMVRTVAIVAALGTAQAQALNWTGVKLNDYAVTNESGEMVVLGTEGSYLDYSNCTKKAVFDGSASTFFDPPATIIDKTVCWAGYQLQSPKMVTRIRFIGRSGNWRRMVGCLFQGANSNDFSDATTLYTVTETAEVKAVSWSDVYLTSTNMFQTFTYLRIIGPNLFNWSNNGSHDEGTCCGNAAEVEFYGIDFPTNVAAPAAPVLIFTNTLNRVMNMRMAAADDALFYQIQRRPWFAADFTDAPSIGYKAAGTTNYWFDTDYALLSDTEYRIRSLNTTGVSDWVSMQVKGYQAATGTWYGTAGSYQTNGMVGARVFDGNITTFHDGIQSTGGNGVWSGLDFGRTNTIIGIRFFPRMDAPERMKGGKFQIADNVDFTNPTDLYTVPSSTPSKTAVTEVVLGTPVKARYARYLSPNGGWGNVAEVEFDLDWAPQTAPQGLTATMSDFTNQYAVLSWNADVSTLFSSTLVYRATSPGGPWTNLVAEIERPVATWTDTNAVVGILYYYKAMYQNTRNGTLYPGEFSETVSYRRCQRLERDWSNLTKLKDGFTVIWCDHPYDGNGAAKNMFDGSLSTFADIMSDEGSLAGQARAGVDFGSLYHMGFYRAYPRSNLAGRINGSALYGSNNTNGWVQDVISAPISGSTAQWYTMTATNTAAYRYFFVNKPTGSFFCNVAELELYGWPAGGEADSVLLAPLNVTFAVQVGHVDIAWEPCANAETYRVERKVNDAADWTAVATGLTSPAYSDTDVVYDGTVYTYRIVSIRGAEEAYSVAYRKVPYLAGNGTGLFAAYSWPYTFVYDASEAVRLAATNSSPYFNWGTGTLIPGLTAATNNVGIVWNGKIIIPFDGNYTFRVSSDDGFALRIDGQFILNRWKAPLNDSGTVSLTQGEHSIRVDYQETTSSAYCLLTWGGCVEEGAIPSTQLIPEPVAALPEPWLAERTFNAPYHGAAVFDGTAKTVTVSSAGMDLSSTSEGYEYLYTTFTGAFDFSAKVEWLGPTPNVGAKALLMVRSALASGSAFIAPGYQVVTANNYTWGGKIRTAASGTLTDLFTWTAGAASTCWLRIKRIDSTFTYYGKTSADGKWQKLGSYTDAAGAFGKTVYIGPAVCTLSSATLLQSFRFSEISLGKAQQGTVVMLQ